MVPDDPGHVEKEGPLGPALEAVAVAQGFFLGHAGYGEWLAGKTGYEYVVARNVPGIYLGDVAGGPFAEVALVDGGGVFVPLGGEDAPAAGLFKGDPHSPYAREEIGEREAGFFPEFDSKFLRIL